MRPITSPTSISKALNSIIIQAEITRNMANPKNIKVAGNARTIMKTPRAMNSLSSRNHVLNSV
jgi:hypothetical protein